MQIIVRKPWGRRTVSRKEGLARIADQMAPETSALRQARGDMDRVADQLSRGLGSVAEFATAQPGAAREVLRVLQANGLLPPPSAPEILIAGADGTPFNLAESTAKVKQRASRPGEGPQYEKLRFTPPKGGGRTTLPESERALGGDINSSFFTSDVHNKVRKVALYQAWLGESWASSSIDAIANRIISGGWLLEPKNKKKPNEKTKWWLQDYFDWCNVDEDFHGIIHSGITDLGWCGECYLEVTWRYNRTLGVDVPYELYTVDPISMEYVLTADRRRIDGYKQVNDAGTPIRLKPRQIIRIWFPDPRNRMKALAPLEKLLNPLVLGLYLQASEQKYFQQGNRGDVAILAKRADQNAAQRLLEFFEEHALGLKNAHRPLIVYGDSDDIELIPLAGRNTMDVPQRQQGVREEILAGMHVPPRQVGIEAPGNLGGGGAADAAEKQFVHTGTDPFKQRYFAQLNFAIINVGFGVDDWTIGTAYADMRDDAEITDIEQKQINAGLTTINAVRAKHKIDPVEGGDVPYLVVGSQLIPVAHLPSLAEAPPPQLMPPAIPGAPGGAGSPAGQGAAPGGAGSPAGQGANTSSAGVKAGATQPQGDNKRDAQGQPKRGELAEASAWCLMAPLAAPDAAFIGELRGMIDPADLLDPPVDAGYPHVTILFGIEYVNANIRRACQALAGILPLPVTLDALGDVYQ